MYSEIYLTLIKLTLRCVLMYNIDDTDKKILGVLKKESRRSFVDIGKTLFPIN